MSKNERLDGSGDGKRDALFNLMAKPTTSALKASKTEKPVSLIQEIDEIPEVPKNVVVETVSPTEPPTLPTSTESQHDGPSMMELMMEAQAQAANVHEKEKSKESKKVTKGFGSGFQKGFFGGGGTKSMKKTKTKSLNNNAIPTLTKQKVDVTSIGAGSSKTGTASVLSEVQRAMKQEEEQKTKQMFQQNPWMTQGLLQQFASNPVLARGLASPKCTAALQAMQSIPTAKSDGERASHQATLNNLKGDKEVDSFIREFGKVMGAHFEQLGDEKARQPKDKGSRPKVEELDTSTGSSGGGGARSTFDARTDANETSTSTALGPLAQQAIERDRLRRQSKGPLKVDESPVDEKRVQEICNDPELSSLLMDPKFQQVRTLFLSLSLSVTMTKTLFLS